MDYPPCESLGNFSAKKRLVDLVNHFKEYFKREPEFFARAPGRVNLIGEHIDYCGYGVFPIAIEKDIIIAVSKNSTGKLNVTNVNHDYKDFTCDINAFKIEGSNPSWHKYILCGIQGVAEKSELLTMTGLDLTVTGSIPPCAGLSSSSALVCASALATCHAHGLAWKKNFIAEVCAESERYIGTQGGGMDQAVSFLAEKGTARMIDFNPLRSVTVKLPPGSTFVVANCLVKKNKAASADFNCRVMECRLATCILAKQSGLPWKEWNRLADLQKELQKSLPQMIELVNENLHEGVYTKEEICTELDTNEIELNKILPSNTYDVQEFRLHDRALHVFSEAHRVGEFYRLCQESINDVSGDVLDHLGKIMTDSHRSAQFLYECSHEKLDKLVDLSMGIAKGARQTGAGWGGCMVALLSPDKVGQFTEKLFHEYYSHEDAGDDYSECLFTSEPGGGACIYTL